MPTYQYECVACNHAFEHFQSMNDKPLKKCPSCGKARLKRLIGTGAGIIFKGSGFYQTDYRSSNYNKSAKADSSASAAASPSSSSSSSAPSSSTSSSSGTSESGAKATSAKSDAKKT